MCGTNHINRYIIYGEGTSIELRVIEIKFEAPELETYDSNDLEMHWMIIIQMKYRKGLFMIFMGIAQNRALVYNDDLKF